MASVGFNPSIQLPKNLTVKRERNHCICCSTGTTIYIDDHRTMIDPNSRIVPETQSNTNESLIARCCSCFSKICCKTGKKNAFVFAVLQKAFTEEFGSDIADTILKEIKGPLTVADFTELQESAKLLRMFKEAHKEKLTTPPSPPPPSRSPSPFRDSADTKSQEEKKEIEALEIGSISFSRSSSLNVSKEESIDISPPPSIEIFRKTYQDRVFVFETYDRDKLERRLKDLLSVGEEKIPEIAATVERKLPRSGSIGSEVIRQQVIEAIREQNLPLKEIPTSHILKKAPSSYSTQAPAQEGVFRILFNRLPSTENPEKMKGIPPGGIFMNQVNLNTLKNKTAPPPEIANKNTYSNLPGIDSID